jgi:hypothetical protein
MAAERAISVSELVEGWTHKERLLEAVERGRKALAEGDSVTHEEAGRILLGATEPKPDISPAPPIKTATICLSLYVERNSKFIRGKKRVWETIEHHILPAYEVKRLREGEYELTIPYQDDADLDSQVNELLSDLATAADDRNCFLQECGAHEKDGERSW